MKINDLKVEEFRKALIDLGYIVKDTNKQLEYHINNAKSEIKLSFDKDGKTITGYQYQSKSKEKKKPKQ
jgi:hypothetical protein